MATKDSLRIFIITNILFWLGLMLAPVALADEAWQQINHPDLDFMFVDPAAHDGPYQDVYLDPVSVWYPAAENTDSDRIGDLQSLADARFADAFRDLGMTVAGEPTDASLIVHFELIDLKSTPVSDEVLAWARQFRFRVLPGRVTLVAEFRDARTGRVLARIADLEDPALNRAAVWSELELELALSLWGDIVAASAAATAGGSLLAGVRD